MRAGSAPVDGAARHGVGFFGFDRLDGHRRCCGLLARGFQFLFGEDEAADVAERLIPNGHLFEMVLPDGVGSGARGAARKGFSLDGDDFSAGVEARVFLRRKEEGDLRAFFPEVAGELVREEESVVAAAGGERRNGLVEAGPFGLDAGLKPLPELEAMHAGAEDNDAEELLAGHGSFLWRGVEVIPGGSALGGPNGNRKRCSRQVEKECAVLPNRVRLLRGNNPRRLGSLTTSYSLFFRILAWHKPLIVIGLWIAR